MYYLYFKENDGILIGPFEQRGETIAFADRWLGIEEVIGHSDEGYPGGWEIICIEDPIALHAIDRAMNCGEWNISIKGNSVAEVRSKEEWINCYHSSKMYNPEASGAIWRCPEVHHSYVTRRDYRCMLPEGHPDGCDMVTGSYPFHPITK